MLTNYTKGGIIKKNERRLLEMTDEQRDMVAKNEKLIYWYISTHGLKMDEYYDLLAIELCNAVINYDPSKGSLSNYFVLRADGAIYKEYRKTQAKKRIPYCLEYMDNLHSSEDDKDMFNSIEFKDWFDRVDKHDILKYKLQGYSQIEIAEILGVSQSFVSKTLKQLRSDYDEYRRSDK